MNPVTTNIETNIETLHPLSPMQQGMLFHTLYAPLEVGMYLQQLVCTWQGMLEPEPFQRAWRQVIEQHPALRSFFVWEGRAEPLQIVCRQISLPWTCADWRNQPGDVQEERLRDFLAADRRRGFAPHQPLLLRFALVRIADNRYHFVWSFHHLLLDGWCVPLLIEEALTYYQASLQGRQLERPRPRPYQDYLAWLRQQDLDQARAFWRARLLDFTDPTPLPGTSPAPGAQGQHYGEREIALPAATTAALQALVKRWRLTLSSLVQAAWGLLLARYSGERDVVFGATVAGRPPALVGVESMIGVFINTLPVRLRLDPQMPLPVLLRQLLAEQVERECYAYTPLVEIQAVAEVPGGTPLFESLVVFENYPLGAVRNEASWPLCLLAMRGYDRTNYPLTLLAMPGPPLQLRIAYDCARFAEDTVDRMLGHLQTVLAAMAADPDRPLAHLPLLTTTERQQLARWNATAAAYPLERCLHELIADQAARTPGAVAAVFENQVLRYRELEAWANRLARHLRALGVGPETIVGVCLERSLELVVALLAVLKAGASYLPLDPGYPRERLAFMLADSQAPVLLTQQHLLPQLPETGATIVCLDRDATALGAQPPTAPPVRISPDNVAYVIYTSGSTGQPKGVMNTHRGIVNRLLWMQAAYRLEATDRVLQKTPFSFDVSIWEFFWPLLSGARLVLARPEGHKDPAYLVALIHEAGITTVHFVPAMLGLFLQTPQAAHCRSLRRVICSGEALPFALQERFFATLEAELHNLYGPTEAAIDVTAWHCQPGDPPPVPIGRPIANTRIYLLDEGLQPVPVGIVGELYIDGVNLARGYYRRPALTAARFLPNPFAEHPGERLYRTGDLALWRPDGRIEYLGRTDHQVKVRGLRIELGEIEAALAAHPGVVQAVVTAVGEGEERRLLAYLVAAGPVPGISELRRHLAERLPESMLPEVFTFLDALPLTPNGKVDRRTLPAPEGGRPRLDAGPVWPCTELEQRIAELWRQVLNLDAVGVHDNFFDLGGNSLRLVPLHQRLRETLAPALALEALFRYPTVHALAQYLSREALPSAAVDPSERGKRRAAQQQTRQRQRHLAPDAGGG